MVRSAVGGGEFSLRWKAAIIEHLHLKCADGVRRQVESALLHIFMHDSESCRAAAELIHVHNIPISVKLGDVKNIYIVSEPCIVHVVDRVKSAHFAS